jgi:hypothetical protein
MKYLKYLFVFLFMSCSSSKVIYDYDVKTDFSKYKTYSFFEDVGDGLNEIDAKRFTRSIERYLDSLGLKKVEKPDFYINVVSEKSDVPRNNNVGIGVGSGGGRRGGVGLGISTGISIGGNKINEKIAIDFVDAGSNQLFWQGIVNAKVKEKINPREREVFVNDLVKKILSKFPPSK